MKTRDLIIVGAGSAGCVLASRLVQEFGVRVTLLEPPSSETSNINRDRPARWLKQLGSSDDWALLTERCGQLAGRSMRWPRGRGLGGSNRINAMIWFPPTRGDVIQLCQASGGCWKPADLNAAYQSVESLVEPERPRWISDPAGRFLEACHGFHDTEAMIYDRLCRRGRRWLPRELLPRGHAGFQIVRGTADRLIWEHDKVVGVRVRNDDADFDLRASLGVVLTSGAIATPAILMRSGVGDRGELARHEIDLRIACESVGANLRDHLIMPVVFQRKPSQTPFLARPTMEDLARWQVMGAGPLGSNLAECGGLIDDRSIQFHVTATHYLRYPEDDHIPAMTIGVNVTKPDSTGCVRLHSQSPHQPPVIEPRYLESESDLETTIRGVRLARRIVARSPLGNTILRELIPGRSRAADQEVARSVARFAQTLYHPIGTCRLGHDSNSVIDHSFRLRGAQQLWVVDASVLPHHTVGNPNATIMTLAWWAAVQIAAQV